MMWTEEELMEKMKQNATLAKRNPSLKINSDKKSKSKYRSVKVAIDGVKFDSIKEGNYYHELKLRKKAGEIKGYCLQPRFVLLDGEEKIEYRADFIVWEQNKAIVVDTKGFETPVFKLKQKLFQAQYPELELVII